MYRGRTSLPAYSNSRLVLVLIANLSSREPVAADRDWRIGFVQLGSSRPRQILIHGRRAAFELTSVAPKAWRFLP
jgi:hypothetical protein